MTSGQVADSLLTKEGLTPKQEAFCLHYLACRNGSEAIRRAGYETSNPDVQAADNLVNPKIRARLTQLRETISLSEGQTVADLIERKVRLTKILRANLVDFVNGDGDVTLNSSVANHEATSEYSITEHHTKDGRTTTRRSLKLRDPISAIQELNKMDRVYSDDTSNRPQVTVINYVFNKVESTQSTQLAIVTPSINDSNAPNEAK